MQKTIAKILLASMFLSLSPYNLFAAGIDATENRAWGENTGWINFAPTNGNVDVTATGITGNAWGENTGWINFTPTNGGVTNTCAGVLGGYAWAQNMGYINFAGVTIDNNGYFTGNATDSLSGSVSFSGTNFAVKTDWRPDCTAPGVPVVTGITTDTGISNSDNITSDNTITISGTAEANSTVEVYINGISVGTALTDASGDWTFDYSATTLADSNYDVTVMGTDSNGNSSVQSNIIDVEIDTTAPTAVTITSPEQGESTNDTTPLVEGTGEPGATVNVVSGSSTCTATVDSMGIYSCELAPALTEGNHTISVTQTDTAGNISTPTTTDIEVDTTFPNAPTVDTALYNTDTPTITGDVNLGAGETLSVTVDGIVYTQTDPELTVSGNEWTLVIPATDSLSDGIQSVEAVVTDSAGNATTDISLSEVEIDTLAPIAPVVSSPTDGTTTNDTTPAFAGTGEPGTVVTVDDGNGHTCTDTVDASGNWSCNIAPALTDGTTSTFSVIQTDLAGNESASTDVDVTIDTTAPTAPTIDNLLSNSATPTITGMVELNTGENLSVTVDGVTYDQTDPELTVTGSTWELIIPTGNEISEGTHEVTATVTDAANNETSDAGTQELTLDFTAPIDPTIEGPTNGAPVVGKAEPFSTVVITTPSGATCTTTADASANYSCVLSPSPVDGEDITVTSTDAAGNESSTTATAMVDVVAPAAPVIDSPTQGSPVSGTAEPNTEIILTTPSGSSCTTTVDALGNFSCDLEPDPLDGETITSSITDAAGNTTTSVAPNAIDLTAPGVPVVTGISEDTGVSDSDEITSDTNPSISGTAEADSTVEIYVNGMLAGTTLADSNGDWTYDYVGPALDDGNYDVTVVGIDTSGNESPQSNVIDVEIDTLSPTIVTINEPIDNSSTSDTTPTVAGTGEPGATVTVDNGQGATCTTVVDSTGVWSCDIAPELTDGNYTFDVEQTDVAGNISEIADVNLEIDTTAPDAPSIDIQLSNDITPEITGEVNLATGEELSVEVDGVVYTQGDGNLVVSGNEWTLNIPTDNALADGDYEVLATVIDEAGNSTEDISIAEIEIDATAPTTPVITSNTDGDATSDTTPTIAGTGEAGSVVTVTDGNGHSCTDTVDASGNWSCNISGPLADGSTPTFIATQTDLAGNESAEESVDIIIDTTAPIAAIIDNQLSNSTTPTITGMVSLDDGDSFSVLVNGEIYTLNDGNLSVDGIMWSLDIPAGKNLVDGIYDVVATIIDSANNTTVDTSSNEIIIDSTAPVTPTLNAPTNGSPVSGTAEAGTTIVVTTPSGATCTTIADSTGNYTCVLNPSPVDGEDVSVVSTDAAGNSSIETEVGGIDTQAPDTPTLVSPTQGQPAIGTAQAGSTVTLNTPSGATCTTTVDVNGNYSCMLSPTPVDGEDVSILVVDDAGNTTTALVSNAIDLSAPTSTTVNAPTNGSPVTGTAEPGTTVTIVTPSGSICSTTVDTSGNYSCELSPTPIHGEDIIATVEDAAGNYDSIIVTAGIDIVAPNAPTIDVSLDNITTNDSTPVIFGTAEAGSSVSIYIDGEKVGEVIADANGEYIFNISTPLNDGGYEITAKATDSAGNNSPESRTVSISIDTSIPAVIDNSVTDNVGDTTATISWETSEPSSSEIEYGLTDIVNQTTGEQDISPRVLSHTTNLSGLLSCTTYFYKTISRDIAGNELVDGIYTLTTTGCEGEAAVESVETTNVVPNVVGTQVTPLKHINEENEEITIKVPAGYNATNTCEAGGAYFQMKQINKEAVVESAGVPAIGDIVIRTYDLSAYCTTGEKVTQFDKPLTITADYPAGQILDANEEFLKLHSFNETTDKWENLDNCSVDTIDKTITCETSHFTTFGIFVDKKYTTGGGGSFVGGNLQGGDENSEEEELELNSASEEETIYEDSSTETDIEENTEVSSTQIDTEETNTSSAIQQSGVVEGNSVEEETNISSTSSVEVESINSKIVETVNTNELVQEQGLLETSANAVEKIKTINGTETKYTLRDEYETCPVIDNLKDITYDDNHYSYLADIEDFNNIEFLKRLERAGVIDGDENSLFDGNREISRVEFLKILLRSHCIEYRNEITADLEFVDTDKDSWEAKVIKKAYLLGIAHGSLNEQGEKIFRGDDIITRSEAIKITMRLALLQLGGEPDNSYDDIDLAWHKKYVDQAQNLGLVNPAEDHYLFEPNDGTTREDFTFLLEKLLHLYR